jgi:hypothetical protein
MLQLEQLLLDSGLVGSGWQVCPRAIVSTANLLRRQDRYVVIDLESGIPSVLVSTYVEQGWRLSSLPLFDDLDSQRLQDWLANQDIALKQRLDPHLYQQLRNDCQSLIGNTEAWKRSEPALTRRPWQLFSRLTSKDFAERYRLRILDTWKRKAITDQTSDQELRSHCRRLLYRPIYWLGLIPGSAGRLLQRLLANRDYRHRARQFLTDSENRRQVIDRYIMHRGQALVAEGRLPAGQSLTSASFCIHYGLSKCTPTGLHRWLSDKTIRGHWLKRLGLMFLHQRFQREYGRLLIRSRIQAWHRQFRLTDQEAQQLCGQLRQPEVDEYVWGFGIHLGLKLLLPLLAPLKVLAAAASVTSGNPSYFLAILLCLPLLRTLATLYRKFSTGYPWQYYRDAIVVGALPTVGSLAYPTQMYATFPQLSGFLLRDFASSVGRLLPIYGGKDSRTELMCIKSVDYIAEAIEVWLKAIRSKVGAVQLSSQDPAKPAVIKLSRWDRVAEQQLALIETELELSTTTPQNPQSEHRDPWQEVA